MGIDCQALVHIVDDDDAVRDSLRALLESAGLAVEDFASAPEFLSRRRACGCLIVDVHMPRMSGLELIEYLSAEGIAFPVIAITGRTDALLRERLRDAGAAAVLEKPLDDMVLLQVIADATEPAAPARPRAT